MCDIHEARTRLAHEALSFGWIARVMESILYIMRPFYSSFTLPWVLLASLTRGYRFPGFHRLPGGTGVTFDHEVARLVGEAGVPVIVAGGLTADNVAACVTDTSSFGVDVSSGVEKSKGLKDITLVQRFLQEARRAQHDLSKHED